MAGRISTCYGCEDLDISARDLHRSCRFGRLQQSYWTGANNPVVRPVSRICTDSDFKAEITRIQTEALTGYTQGLKNRSCVTSAPFYPPVDGEHEL